MTNVREAFCSEDKEYQEDQRKVKGYSQRLNPEIEKQMIIFQILKFNFTVTLSGGRQLKFSFRCFPLKFVIRRQFGGKTFKALSRSQSENVQN